MTWGFDAKGSSQPQRRDGAFGRSAFRPEKQISVRSGGENGASALVGAQISRRLAAARKSPVHVATHAGGDRKPAINCRIATKRFRGIATSAIWKAV